MRIAFYTNENTKQSVVYVQRSNESEVRKSEPQSLAEYEVYKMLHLGINAEGGEEQLQILLDQLLAE